MITAKDNAFYCVPPISFDGRLFREKTVPFRLRKKIFFYFQQIGDESVPNSERVLSASSCHETKCNLLVFSSKILSKMNNDLGKL